MAAGSFRPSRSSISWPWIAWLWGPVVAYCALIYALSSVSDVPALPGGLTDKAAHLLLYSGLGFLFARALTGGGPRRVTVWVALGSILATTLYGLSDETHQLYVPNRAFEMKDLAADLAGASLGTAARWLWGIIRS